MVCAFVSVACAVNLDTNITLRSVCVNSQGSPCTENAYWTVYNPNQTIIYNNTLGNTIGTLSNFTFWANMTGVYYVLVNYTSQNVTSTYNIVVEDYRTVEIKSIWDNTKMLLFSLTLISIILCMFYASFKLEQEHLFLKVLLLFGGVLFMLGGIGMSIYGFTDANQIRIGSTIFWVLISIFIVMFTYLIIYIFVQKAKFAAEESSQKRDAGKQW